MKGLIASSVVALMTAGVVAPAVGEPEQKTELVRLDGQKVDAVILRHAFGHVWVVDNQNLLWRDESRDDYLVTLKSECEQLELRRPFDFYPGSPWRLQSNRSYEVRPQAGPVCDVTRIAHIDDERATALRESALRRAWR